MYPFRFRWRYQRLFERAFPAGIIGFYWRAIVWYSLNSIRPTRLDARVSFVRAFTCRPALAVISIVVGIRRTRARTPTTYEYIFFLHFLPFFSARVQTIRERLYGWRTKPRSVIAAARYALGAANISMQLRHRRNPERFSRNLCSDYRRNRMWQVYTILSDTDVNDVTDYKSNVSNFFFFDFLSTLETRVNRLIINS